jgi:hypothetical protein
VCYPGARLDPGKLLETSQIYLACVILVSTFDLAKPGDQPNLFGVCFPSVRLGLIPNISSTLSSICPSDPSVLDEFPDDVAVVISLYDLLEALASQNSFLQPHLVLSNDIPPHLRGITPVYASLAISPSHANGHSTSNP